MCHTALLCMFVWMLLKAMFIHMERRCRHVSFSFSGHRLHRGEGDWV